MPRSHSPKEALGSPEVWYRFVMDRLPLGVITVNHERRVTYINAYACEITGWEAKEALGRFCGEVLRGGQCQSNCPLQSALNQTHDTVDMRSTITDRAKRTIPVRFRTVALYDENQEQVGAVEAFYDISQTVALEQERARTLSYFAHDMKSPLVGAIGFMDRLLVGKAGEQNPKQLEYQRIVRDQLKHVQQLVEDYLDVLRLNDDQVRLRLEPLNLSDLLEELAIAYRSRAEEKGLIWRMALPGDLPAVMADRHRLSRALANLIDNAIKFSHRGEVEISCHTLGEDRVRVLVCDQGPGLAPEDATKLFSPFFRGSAGKTAEGTGLGLAAVKNIIQAHGGEVFASNRDEGGACFAALLPMASAGPQPRLSGQDRA